MRHPRLASNRESLCKLRTPTSVRRGAGSTNTAPASEPHTKQRFRGGGRCHAPRLPLPRWRSGLRWGAWRSFDSAEHCEEQVTVPAALKSHRLRRRGVSGIGERCSTPRSTREAGAGAWHPPPPSPRDPRTPTPASGGRPCAPSAADTPPRERHAESCAHDCIATPASHATTIHARSSQGGDQWATRRSRGEPAVASTITGSCPFHASHTRASQASSHRK